MFELAATVSLQNYFPDHQTSPDIVLFETREDLYCQPFSVSRLVSEILQPKSSRRTGSAREVAFSVRDRSLITSNPRINPRTPRLAHLVKLGADVEDCKEEEEEEEKSFNPAGKAKRRNSWQDMPKFLMAGAVSTIISRTCVAPLERIKLECIVQGSKHTWVDIVQLIWISEGLRGFWKGNALNLFRMVPFKSINFICYDMYLDRLLCFPGKNVITNQDRLIGGGISGVIATSLCIPLDTIRTRLVAPGGEALGGVAGCFFHMIRKEGFFSLYKGLTPALISMGPASAIFYTVYDILKTSHLSHRKKRDEDVIDGDEIGAARTLIYGAIAGACAETVTYPLEVIRRQLQLQRSTKLGLASAFVEMIERDGARSLFAGLIPSTLQVLPSVSLSYYFYELMKSLLKIN